MGADLVAAGLQAVMVTGVDPQPVPALHDVAAERDVLAVERPWVVRDAAVDPDNGIIIAFRMQVVVGDVAVAGTRDQNGRLVDVPDFIAGDRHVFRLVAARTRPHPLFAGPAADADAVYLCVPYLVVDDIVIGRSAF